MFNIIKRYFDRGIYDKEAVSKFVLSGALSTGQYKEITGEDYTR